jgi:hypothetical protein
MELARPRKTNGVGVQVEDTQICVVMVGLPARGKSLIAQKGTYDAMSLQVVNSLAYPQLTHLLQSYPLSQVAIHRRAGLQCRQLPST